MPWGYTSIRQPAPQRLTLEELLRLQQEQYQPSARPAAKRSLSELDPEELRRVRQQSLFAGLAAAGASMQNRNWNIAGQAAGQIGAMQDQALYDANARQEQAWQAEEEKRAAEYQQRAQQTQQAAIYGMYQRAVEGEAPDSPWISRAEAAARAGNMSELATMASPEVKGKRAGARAKGYDPDAWDTNERLTKELAAELDRQKEAAAQAGEMERRAEQARIDREARIAEEKALREEGLDRYAPPQYEPLSRVAQREELVQSIRDKHARQGGAATRRIMEANGVPGLAEIDANGQLTFKPAIGIPEKKGAITYMTFQNEDMTKTPYRLDEKSGEWYPMKVNATGAPPRQTTAAGPSGGNKNSAPQANHWRNLAADALSKGGTEEEALRRLRAIGPQNGFTPEQILENAKALARKRGWKG